MWPSTLPSITTSRRQPFAAAPFRNATIADASFTTTVEGPAIPDPFVARPNWSGFIRGKLSRLREEQRMCHRSLAPQIAGNALAGRHRRVRGGVRVARSHPPAARAPTRNPPPELIVIG